MISMRLSAPCLLFVLSACGPEANRVDLNVGVIRGAEGVFPALETEGTLTITFANHEANRDAYCPTFNGTVTVGGIGLPSKLPGGWVAQSPFARTCLPQTFEASGPQVMAAFDRGEPLVFLGDGPRVEVRAPAATCAFVKLTALSATVTAGGRLKVRFSPANAIPPPFLVTNPKAGPTRSSTLVGVNADIAEFDVFGPAGSVEFFGAWVLSTEEAACTFQTCRYSCTATSGNGVTITVL